MAYSNVTPPALPAYDAETNGFYLLVFNYELGAEDWYSVQLRYAPWRFSYDEALGITNTGNNYLQVYSDGTWGDFGQNQETLSLKPGRTGQTYQRIYTNHNIFDADDQLYMTADTVTPLDEETEPEKFPIRGFINGLVMALCGRPIQWPSREPVAYLYNGVQLPALPEWDSDAYYGAHIEQVGETYWLRLSTVPLVKAKQVLGSGTRDCLFALPAEVYPSYSVYSYTATENGWVAGSYFNPYFVDNSNSPPWLVITDGKLTCPVIWASYDIKDYDTDGVYLAASEPVPVYEQEE